MGTAVAPTLWDHQVATCRSPVAGPEPAGAGAPRRVNELGRAPTGKRVSLDEAVTRLWREVMGHRAVACPWCQGEMRPRYGTAALPVGARCQDCGATLA